ncbi:hypothetical protein FD44_GL001740 [Secundilactobacillus malefermentans DSM 5705 = KCTC 3548]|nr:hypothetical protein FD44_GL001740 [Secundilactobacillus malefermentans DSM 5705 = KCTC 3548]
MIQVEKELFNMLDIYRRSQQRLNLNNPNNLIFAQTNGNPSSDSGVNQTLKTTLKRINADKIITFHGL